MRLLNDKTQLLICFCANVHVELQRRFQGGFFFCLFILVFKYDRVFAVNRIWGYSFCHLLFDIDCLQQPGLVIEGAQSAIKLVCGTIISQKWACSCDCWHICLSVEGEKIPTNIVPDFYFVQCTSNNHIHGFCIWRLHQITKWRNCQHFIWFFFLLYFCKCVCFV